MTFSEVDLMSVNNHTEKNQLSILTSWSLFRVRNVSFSGGAGHAIVVPSNTNKTPLMDSIRLDF